MDKKYKGKIEKVVINVGVGRMSQANDFESRVVPELIKELGLITGQKAEVIKSKSAISGFKLRIGQIIGLKVTLRKKRAVDFLDRLINIVLPRIKDFRGLKPSSVDKSGVLNIGLRDKSIFPEIVPEESKISFGLEVSVIPKFRNRQKSVEFLKEIKVPIKHG
ncbi:MAG: 50S ribosomal protein L5 [Candidatus Paceibacterota bacterium]